MFNFIQKRITKSIDKLSKKALVQEEDIIEVIRDIKLSLLEADVNLIVVKTFIKNVKEKAINTNIVGSLNASQQFIKIVKDELIEILGKYSSNISINSTPHKIMMVGLQGSGKTTTAVKLGHFFRKKKLINNPLMVACDIYRPAAVQQLITLSKSVSLPYYEEGTASSAQIIAENALQYAKENQSDLIIFDTAGRLAIDENLMQELEELKKIIKPNEIIFVADAMSGQDVVNVAKAFHDRLKLTSTIITKLDGDARGGAALSIRYLLNIPIKFIGTGEGISNIDLFHPERMAERILGMGDILSLIEKAQDVIDGKKANKLLNKFVTGVFTLNDLLDSILQLEKLGSLSKIASMIPGLNKISPEMVEKAQQKAWKYQVLMSSMTLKERNNPKLLKDPSRKARVIKGSGRPVQEFNQLLNEYEKMAQKVKDISTLIKSGKFDPSALGGLGGFGSLGSI
ncbi:signal recognition particle protein [Mycoplasma sp. M5725]|uniref:Signal recognition particle protein n=1 Tax=Mycoplasma phocimorsus TaxID=3045839 RepID=A0AAJ1UWP2_9MOLU|nr:signal recognition particle protein [Mycoplasma phocimorsus]MDJ1645655.1 signal recognition particle protein [Mycoplasma phocimorsus]